MNTQPTSRANDAAPLQPEPRCAWRLDTGHADQTIPGDLDILRERPRGGTHLAWTVDVPA
jgi:hypothetical protein